MYDPEFYRDKQEVEEWKKRDPINFVATVEGQDLWKDEDWTRMEEEVAARDRPSRWSLPRPGSGSPIEELTRFVYSEDAPAMSAEIKTV